MDEHYEKLELTRAASKEDIKKAYKELSYNNHPDRGGDIKKFKEILDAYAALNNRPFKNRSEIFTKYYNQEDDKNNNGKKRCSNIIETIDVTLEELYNKKKIEKYVTINTICTECHGIGISEKVRLCKNCDTYNIKKNLSNIDLNSSSNSRPDSKLNIRTDSDYLCQRCNSEGYIVVKECACCKCKGSKILKKKIKFVIKLNPRMMHGKQIVYYNMGNEYPKYKRGNVLFLLNEIKHDVFKRINNKDLYMKYHINLVEALSGFSFKFEHLDGRKFYSDIQNVIRPGFKRVLNEGMIRGKSNLIVEFVVEFPQFTINHYERMELEKMTMLEKKCVDFDPDEYEGCYITTSSNPFRNDLDEDYNSFDTY